MSKKLITDNDNLPIGFYETDVHAPAQIPAEAIDITEAQWQEFQDFPDERKWNDSTGLVEVYSAPIILADYKVANKETIKQAFNDELLLGYICPVNSIKMDTTQIDIDLFQAGYDLAIELAEIVIDVRDYDNVVNSGIAVATALTMLTELKTNYRTLLTKKWTLQAQTDDAVDVSGVDAIVW